MKNMIKGILLATTFMAHMAFAKTAIVDTNMGNITIELNEKAAPITVANFITYAKSGHYNGTVFHRVMAGFMIQGGGFDEKMAEKPTRAPIKNEAANGLSNDKYTIAMARTDDADSATSQFFINVANNNFLNKSSKSAGYTVFGRVVTGTAVVDQIAKAYVQRSRYSEAQPISNIVIRSITIQ
jgi:peptidylprolyl isomerase/peptidyl-prolyl cis-trans isomerase A (cyclophilin A)/peptidyl-prolyl cis-trans isomerase B (cyclophilin B)